MFGISLPEMITIAVVAVIFLGPDKLPDAMIKAAKFFKFFKQTINSARNTFEQEVKIAELKEDAQKYRNDMENTLSGVRKKLTFEELDELKNNLNSTKDSINENLTQIKNELSNPLDILNKAEISSDDFSEPLAQNSPQIPAQNAEILAQNSPKKSAKKPGK